MPGKLTESEATSNGSTAQTETTTSQGAATEDTSLDPPRSNAVDLGTDTMSNSDRGGLMESSRRRIDAFKACSPGNSSGT